MRNRFAGDAILFPACRRFLLELFRSLFAIQKLGNRLFCKPMSGTFFCHAKLLQAVPVLLRQFDSHRFYLCLHISPPVVLGMYEYYLVCCLCQGALKVMPGFARRTQAGEAE